MDFDIFSHNGGHHHQAKGRCGEGNSTFTHFVDLQSWLGQFRKDAIHQCDENLECLSVELFDWDQSDFNSGEKRSEIAGRYVFQSLEFAHKQTA